MKNFSKKQLLFLLVVWTIALVCVFFPVRFIIGFANLNENFAMVSILVGVAIAIAGLCLSIPLVTTIMLYTHNKTKVIKNKNNFKM